jgi:hypothetical protein
MIAPDVNKKCGQSNCGHLFGIHYVTFDNKKSGCTADTDQKDGPCFCKGFTVLYIPRITLDRPDNSLSDLRG